MREPEKVKEYKVYYKQNRKQNPKKGRSRGSNKEHKGGKKKRKYE